MTVGDFANAALIGDLAGDQVSDAPRSWQKNVTRVTDWAKASRLYPSFDLGAGEHVARPAIQDLDVHCRQIWLRRLGTDGSQTHRRREMDSNLRFPNRSAPVFETAVPSPMTV